MRSGTKQLKIDQMLLLYCFHYIKCFIISNGFDCYLEVKVKTVILLDSFLMRIYSYI